MTGGALCGEFLGLPLVDKLAEMLLAPQVFVVAFGGFEKIFYFIVVCFHDC